MQEYILKIKFDENKTKYLREAVEQFDSISVEGILTTLEKELRAELKQAEIKEMKGLKGKLKKTTETKTYLLNQWSGYKYMKQIEKQ